MKRFIFNNSTDSIVNNGKYFIVSIFFFIIGISAGVFTELMMSSVEKGNAISYFNQYFLLENMNNDAFTNIFMKSAGSNLGIFLVIICSGLSAIGFPIAIAALTYKGATLGFSAALLIESLSFKGIAFIFTSMIPQNLILIPAFLVATVVSLSMAFYILSNRKTGIKKSLASSSGPYAFLNIIIALVILTGCFVESFICPILTKLIG
ncbi:stage II sporulation protein M [Anaerovorax odorimutans]|uniref:stage II sporulation protein M n=1 Tax=Anaerovorax odorimutans TaxID=109327 RepID=UPI000481EABD|nr:stage II sporulation protein M [Anaerovorax odorimutans]